MLRGAFQQLLTGSLSRRQFLDTLTKLGIGAVAATQLAEMMSPVGASPARRLSFGMLSMSSATPGLMKRRSSMRWSISRTFIMCSVCRKGR